MRRFVKAPTIVYKPKKQGETDPVVKPILDRGLRYIAELAKGGESSWPEVPANQWAGVRAAIGGREAFGPLATPSSLTAYPAAAQYSRRKDTVSPAILESILSTSAWRAQLPVALRSPRGRGPGHVSPSWLGLLLLVAPSLVCAGTVLVPDGVATIQGAIIQAIDGDDVVVAPGTYLERLDFLGKAITVESRDGPKSTIIDAAGLGSVIAFKSGETRASVLRGFTIRRGYAFDGAGIYVSFASPTIVGNIITGNDGCDGVGLFLVGGGALIQGNDITRNFSTACSGGRGGGIWVSPGASDVVEIRDNTISGNRVPNGDGGGVALSGDGHSLIQGNTIAGNCCGNRVGGGQGGGIDVYGGMNTVIASNFVVDNRGVAGSSMHWSAPGNHGPVVVNNTMVAEDLDGPTFYTSQFSSGIVLANNIIATLGTQETLVCGGSVAVMTSNDVFNRAGVAYACGDDVTGTAGNISIDPQFRDPDAGDFHLAASSPCIDAGDGSAPHLPPTDIDGDDRVLAASGPAAVVDIGADEFVAGSVVPTPTTSTTQPVLYGVVQLPSLGGGGTSAQALGPNGEVVGASSLPGDFVTHAFLYVAGTMTDLGVLGVPSTHPTSARSFAFAVNGARLVAGSSSTTIGYEHAFLYGPSGFIDLGVAPGAVASSAFAINASGDVLVVSYPATGQAVQSAVYHEGVLTDLGTLDPSSIYGTQATDINAAGQIVGNSGGRPFLYEAGAMTEIPGFTVYGARVSRINAAGQILGYGAVGSSGDHAFIHHDGVTTDLGTLGGSYSLGTRINDLGMVVGESDTAEDGRHAFVYTDGVMQDLGALKDGSCTPSSEAQAINNVGDVAGVSSDEPFVIRQGVMRALNSLILRDDAVRRVGGDVIGMNDAGQILLSDPLYGRAFLLTPMPGATTSTSTTMTTFTTTTTSSSSSSSTSTTSGIGTSTSATVPSTVTTTLVVTTTTLVAVPPACDDAAGAAAVRGRIESACPCGVAASHVAYVGCVNAVLHAAVRAGTLPRACGAAMRRCAMRSTCGLRGAVTCCRVAEDGAVNKCTIKRSAAACRDRKGGRLCVGAGSSCCEACRGMPCGTDPAS